jgi:NTP pyrophosphatase (non-canonical NTP hydrolase)
MALTTTTNGAFMAPNDALSNFLYEIDERMVKAAGRYGEFASTHEAMGVALEEWDELREAIKSNDIPMIEHECLDLAAVLIRLATSLRNSNYTRNRSVK